MTVFNRYAADYLRASSGKVPVAEQAAHLEVATVTVSRWRKSLGLTDRIYKRRPIPMDQPIVRSWTAGDKVKKRSYGKNVWTVLGLADDGTYRLRMVNDSGRAIYQRAHAVDLVPAEPVEKEDDRG